jgi:hypothetical protein
LRQKKSQPANDSSSVSEKQSKKNCSNAGTKTSLSRPYPQNVKAKHAPFQDSKVENSGNIFRAT